MHQLMLFEDVTFIVQKSLFFTHTNQNIVIKTGLGQCAVTNLFLLDQIVQGANWEVHTLNGEEGGQVGRV